MKLINKHTPRKQHKSIKTKQYTLIRVFIETSIAFHKTSILKHWEDTRFTELCLNKSKKAIPRAILKKLNLQVREINKNKAWLSIVTVNKCTNKNYHARLGSYCRRWARKWEFVKY